MANYLSCLFLVRVLLPVCLSVCVIFRQNLLSFIYLLLLFYIPWVYVPTGKSMAGSTGRYLQIVMICSILTSIAQLSFQIVLLSMQPYGHFLQDCDILEKILRHIGLVRLDGISFRNGVLALGPEALMLISSVIVYLLSSKLVDKRKASVQADPVLPSTTAVIPQFPTTSKKTHRTFMVTLGKYAVLFSLCFAGVMRPSILNGVYFITFLGGMTWWACYKDLRKPFAITLYCVLVLAALHIVALFGIQLQWVQDFVTDDCNYCRYLGLTRLVVVNCTDPRNIIFEKAEWASYLNPIVLLWLYFILGLEARLLLKPSLIRGVSPASKYSSTGHHPDVVGGTAPGNMYQDALGSVTITDGVEDMQLQPLGGEAEASASLFEQIVDCVSSIIQIISRSSYIATIIIMMAWSITYHSWLTFVLLLWASLMWMIPNQRRAMLRCSPFLVFYAECLLIIQFIYGMDLNDDELPQEVQGINLRQIGFARHKELPCKPLLAKSLYTLMFWITMRQFMQERFEQRNMSTLEDMAAPLQITVNTATRGFSEEPLPESNSLLTRFGDSVKRFLTKFWIWVVAIMLFVIGISGGRMTIFRILYMALFLVFVLVFQFSYKAWRKMMYGFWLMVIVYSMSILVLVYTYQFDNFPEYWKSVGIPITLQLDIGLESFKTGELFIRLLTPTFFLVITVIQLHYFHQNFLAISDIKSRIPTSRTRDSSTYKSEGSSVAGGHQTEEDDHSQDAVDIEPPENFSLPSIHNLKNLSSAELQALGRLLYVKIEEVVELIWLFLELHMLKIMLLSIMLLSLYDVCALHFILLLLIVCVISFGRKFQFIATKICSVIVSGLLLAKMIYQIKYIKHNVYDVNCTDMVKNFTISESDLERLNFTANDVKWVGLRKVNPDESLSELLKGYIGLILIATLLAVINIRQRYKRHLQSHSVGRPYFMFPNVRRADADRDFKTCIKYFFNYGFYKFGVEICMMVTVALIGSRMDVYAVLYCFWLCLMFALSRESLKKVWPFYQGFIVITLPLQYALAVGLPPGLCIEYPWYHSQRLRRIQDWMFLPDPLHPPAAYKLVCDFILLMLVYRQSVVFRIENNLGTIYAGGSNGDIPADNFEDPSFINPVPDHISHIRSWLDIIKRGVLSGFLWATLVTVFLAGTNRVSIFSVGYLIGSFIFLWQGEDFYLRPIRVILRWWTFLLGYNVSVITVKALLQIVGCIFIEEAKENVCWGVQLFAIACIKKFHDTVTSAGIIDPTECTVSQSDVGLAWDGVCFGFLILMRRVFQSHYFIHLINETKSMTILASRGAELIEELRQKQINTQQDQEHHILEKIKLKMERIKAAQQKIKGPVFKEPTNHFAEGIEPHQRRTWPKSNRSAIRSGDYYMFEDLEDSLLEADKEEKDLEDIKEKSSHDGRRRLTLSKLLTSAMKMDIEQAANLALSNGQSTSRPVLEKKEEFVQISRKKSSFFSVQSQMSAGAAVLPESSGTSDPSYNVEPSPAESYKSNQVPRSEKADENAASTDKGHSSSIKDEEQITHEKDSLPSLRSKDSRSISIQDEVEIEEKTKSSGSSWWHTVASYLKFAWAFIESAMVTMTEFLNRLSKDYRYVIEVLALEKKMLKETYGFGEGQRIGSSMIWQPLQSTSTRLDVSFSHDKYSKGSQNNEDDIDEADDTVHQSESRTDIRKSLIPDMPSNATTSGRKDDRHHSVISSSAHPSIRSHLFNPPNFEEMDERQGLRESEQPPLVRLLLALWFAIISHSELVCYFMVFLHQVKSATILSLPLPLMVFLWGTLSVPRPTKTFWVTLIAYTEVIVILKCMFQFEILPWNQQAVPDKAPFFAPRILGIERQPHYAIYDLSLLLIAFFHRYMLKSLGLWKSSYEESTEFDENIAIAHIREKEEDLAKKSSYVKSMSNSGCVISTPGGRKLSIVGDARDLEAEDDDDNLSFMMKHSNVSGMMLVKKEMEEPCQHFPQILSLAAARYFDSTRNFFENLLSSAMRVTADVYAYMFMCDFFNFMVVIFGFAAFGTQQGDGGVTEYLIESKIPVPFLVMLILQFALIVIDRALFLRKFIFGKILFQFFLVIGVHIWMFFILPAVTERSFHAALPPQMWYMVKCFYLLLSAYQIRSGYPTRILGNFVCKRYNIINMCFFKAFMIVPFLFELRALMDWIWTDTSMTLWDWLKMEDIFAHIFEHKCARRMEIEYPQPRGQKKSPTVKYFMGGGLLFAIIGLIWFPLVFFAVGNTVGSPNPPYDVTISLRMGPYPPIYKMSAQNSSIVSFSEKEWAQLSNTYTKNRVAQTFLSNYDYGDVAAAVMNLNSSTVWDISPPDQLRFLDDLNSDRSIIVKLTWTVSRVSNDDKVPVEATSSKEWKLEAKINGQPNIVREELKKMLVGDSNTTCLIKYIFPKFLKVNNRGNASPVTQLMEGDDNESKAYRNVWLKLFHGSYMDRNNTDQWWEVTEDINDMNYQAILENIPKHNSSYLVLYTFNDRTFPATLKFISSSGVIGLYLTVVIVISKLIRSMISGLTFKIMFTELPNVDRILQLCLDIYLVRESGELALEEDLFAKLVFLYRSPETLIKWTRPREEEEADEGGEGQAQPMIAQ